MNAVLICQSFSSNLPFFLQKTFKQGMDFSDFRASKDLFDVIIVVDGHENYLHSFPFYVKSEYFRDLAKERESTLLSDK